MAVTFEFKESEFSMGNGEWMVGWGVLWKGHGHLHGIGVIHTNYTCGKARMVLVWEALEFESLNHVHTQDRLEPKNTHTHIHTWTTLQAARN